MNSHVDRTLPTARPYRAYSGSFGVCQMMEVARSISHAEITSTSSAYVRLKGGVDLDEDVEDEEPQGNCAAASRNDPDVVSAYGTRVAKE